MARDARLRLHATLAETGGASTKRRLSSRCASYIGAHCLAIYTRVDRVYTGSMAKHLIDLDEEALRAARTELGTNTIRDTVNEALRRATSRRDRLVSKAIDTLANAKLSDRADAWR